MHAGLQAYRRGTSAYTVNRQVATKRAVLVVGATWLALSTEPAANDMHNLLLLKINEGFQGARCEVLMPSSSG